MKNIAVLYSKTEKSFKLEIYSENNQEFVEINDKLVEIKYINLREFERFEIIEK